MVLVATAVIASRSTFLSAQGCEPIRFGSPVSLGSAGEAYLPDQQWQITLAYRRLYSNHFYVGSRESDNSGPGGASPVFEVHTVVADVAYSLTPRVLFRVSVPYSTGSFKRRWPDNAFHRQTASGIGDVSVIGETWIADPRSGPRGNLSVGLGIKAPTGSHTRPSEYYLATGPVPFPADQPIQPGDGGWGVLAKVESFRQLGVRASLYASGMYMMSPKGRSDVAGGPATTPNASLYWSVPDVYFARAGVAFDPFEQRRLSMSLGARIDGIPVHDLIGGGDDHSIKRSSYIVYADPGASYMIGRNTFAFSVPYRVKLNRLKSVTEQATGGLNAGGFAKYLVFASVSRRF